MSRHLMLFAALSIACTGGEDLPGRVASTTVTAGALELHTLFALPPFTDAPMPVYLVIVNRGEVADTLLGATSPVSGRVLLHGGGMAALGAVAVAPGDSVVLAPGRLHLMLEPPLPALVRGDSVPVTLRFAVAGEVPLVVPVLDYVEADLVR